MWIYNTETNNAKNLTNVENLKTVIASDGTYELLAGMQSGGNSTIAKLNSKEDADSLLRNIMSCIERGQRTFLIP